MRTISIAAIALLGAASAPALQDGGTTYHVGHHAKFVNISFESQADIETIVGTANAASGEVRLDGQGGGSVSLSVPVAALKTGIDMRDEHLRSPMWLDAAKFPAITFVSKKAEPVKDQPSKVAVTGDLTVHGVAKEIAVTVEWKALPEELTKKGGFGDGKWIKFSTAFDVKLSEHGVKVPEVAVGKVNDTWKVQVVVYGSTSPVEKK